MPMDPPQFQQGGSPYAAFAKVFSRCHDQFAEPGPSSSHLDAPISYDAVLDEGSGMITQIMKTLEDTLVAQKNGTAGDSQMSSLEYDSLLLEHRTWGLIRAVYDNRLHRTDPLFEVPSATQTIQENPYTPPEELVQIIVNEEDDLSLWATLLEFLQSRPIFTSAPPIEARHGYLPSTLRKAKAARLNPSAAAGSVPSSLDPDFTVRDPQSQSLAGEDRTYQAPLLDALFDLVRHGELDQAINVCEAGGEPWRAASLLGGRRWAMGGLTSDSMPDIPLTGNRARALWKKSCRAIAKNPTLSQSERSLYAALICDLQTLLPSCTTWEDYLWAHILHRLENQIDQKWRGAGGFWVAEDRTLGTDEEDSVEIGVGGLDEVFDAIGNIKTGQVAQDNVNPYYAARKLVILGQSEVLLDLFADRIPNLASEIAPDLLGPLLRFFAHLVLVLRTLSQPVPEAAANTIIEAYLRVLEREGNDSLVAMYAACLREGNGEESYARFLRSMDAGAPKEAKQEALMRAQQYNLDVAAIARSTVRTIMQEAFAIEPSMSAGQPDITAFSARLTERDVYLIRSIEWLTMVPETRYDALVRSNDLARYFLALGKANAAQSLLKTLPDDITALGEEDDFQFEEHAHYRKLFDVFRCHDDVDDVESRRPKETASKVEQHNWSKRLGIVLEETRSETCALLTNGWLRFRFPQRTAYTQKRTRELARIRQIFVPDLVLRLHAGLVGAAPLFPQLLQRALDMTKLVASEEYGIYSEFFGREGKPVRLVAYLDKVREASLLVLAGGSGTPFKAVAGAAAAA